MTLLELVKKVDEAVRNNEGKPALMRFLPDLTELLRRRFVRTGNSNVGQVCWLTDKAYVYLKDAEELAKQATPPESEPIVLQPEEPKKPKEPKPRKVVRGRGGRP